MKKIIAATLCIAMCLALLSACGTQNQTDPSDEPITSQEPSDTPEASDTPEDTESQSLEDLFFEITEGGERA